MKHWIYWKYVNEMSCELTLWCDGCMLMNFKVQHFHFAPLRRRRHWIRSEARVKWENENVYCWAQAMKKKVVRAKLTEKDVIDHQITDFSLLCCITHAMPYTIQFSRGVYNLHVMFFRIILKAHLPIVKFNGLFFLLFISSFYITTY